MLIKEKQIYVVIPDKIDDQYSVTIEAILVDFEIYAQNCLNAEVIKEKDAVFLTFTNGQSFVVTVSKLS